MVFSNVFRSMPMLSETKFTPLSRYRFSSDKSAFGSSRKHACVSQTSDCICMVRACSEINMTFSLSAIFFAMTSIIDSLRVAVDDQGGNRDVPRACHGVDDCLQDIAVRDHLCLSP